MTMRAAVACAVLAASLTSPRPASAHRLDEYLQATRLAIGVDRVDVEIDLTPGIDVAPAALGWIDTNQDGAISPSEANAYAEGVVRDVTLEVDGTPMPVRLKSVEAPAADAMRQGIGAIRVRAAAAMSSMAGGSHRVAFRNAHRPESSVYLANVLVPDDPRVVIGAPHRDRAQRELSIDYQVTTSGNRAWWSTIGTAALGLLVAGRRRSGRRS